MRKEIKFSEITVKEMIVATANAGKDGENSNVVPPFTATLDDNIRSNVALVIRKTFESSFQLYDVERDTAFTMLCPYVTSVQPTFMTQVAHFLNQYEKDMTHKRLVRGILSIISIDNVLIGETFCKAVAIFKFNSEKQALQIENNLYNKGVTSHLITQTQRPVLSVLAIEVGSDYVVLVQDNVLKDDIYQWTNFLGIAPKIDDYAKTTYSIDLFSRFILQYKDLYNWNSLSVLRAFHYLANYYRDNETVCLRDLATDVFYSFPDKQTVLDAFKDFCDSEARTALEGLKNDFYSHSHGIDSFAVVDNKGALKVKASVGEYVIHYDLKTDMNNESIYLPLIAKEGELTALYKIEFLAGSDSVK